MKYWKFDVCALISDFEKNKKTLASVEEALNVARGYLRDPASETTRGEVEGYVKMLELRRDEYEWYSDMVILGLNELPEVERNVLKWWLIDNWRDSEIMSNSGIKTKTELNRIKQISLAKFHDIVMP